METTRGPEGLFFQRFAWIILFTVIACFGGKALFDSEDLPPITWLHHAHALSMLAWFGLFALQGTLRHRDLALHRTMGRLSPLVVLLFLGFALPITQLNWTRMGGTLVVTANTVNLVLFLVLYGSALALRHRGAAHKRLMTYATLSIMGPALGRVPEIFDQSPMAAVPLVLGFQLAPLVRDLIVDRRPHPASVAGFVLLFAAIPVILGLSGSDAWAGLVSEVLGPRGGVADRP